MSVSLNSSAEATCPLLARRWDRDQRGAHPSEDNVCYLWEDQGAPPDVVQYCAGTLPWHGERFVPVPVESQWSICLTGHYGSCRWLRERQWHTRETTVVCPLLGSEADRQQKYLYPSTLNICHAHKDHFEVQGTGRKLLSLLNVDHIFWRALRLKRRGKAAPVAAERQREMCLTKLWPECELYRKSVPDGRGLEM
jgi:hypothetical protein